MDHSEIFRTFALLAREYRVPGAQLAIVDRDHVMAFEFGHETAGSDLPMTADAKVPIGSITKAFTAALAMVLVSDGDVELDEPVAAYVPELHRRPDGSADEPPVTLRHLLSHTAGLPSTVESKTVVRSVRGRVLDSWRRLVPVARPGLAFSYSNLGFVLVGHIVEAVTGMTWWEAMEAILLKPLGIEPMFIASPSGVMGNSIVTGHSVHDDRIRPVAQSLEVVDAPAGALAVSAIDLISFGRLLITGATADGVRLIEPDLLREMREPAPGAEPYGLADGWGLGLALFQAGNARWLGHDGTADGTACHLRVAPEDGTVVALTTNASTGFAMWDALSTRLFSTGLAAGGRGSEKPPVAAQESCAGDYVNGDVEYTVVARDGGLHLVVDGEPFAELICHDNLEFEVRDGGHPQAGRFLRDRVSGRIDMMQLSGRLARRPLVAAVNQR